MVEVKNFNTRFKMYMWHVGFLQILYIVSTQIHSETPRFTKSFGNRQVSPQSLPASILKNTFAVLKNSF